MNLKNELSLIKKTEENIYLTKVIVMISHVTTHMTHLRD
jgi:hypothetical protein